MESDQECPTLLCIEGKEVGSQNESDSLRGLSIWLDPWVLRPCGLAQILHARNLVPSFHVHAAHLWCRRYV